MLLPLTIGLAGAAPQDDPQPEASNELAQEWRDSTPLQNKRVPAQQCLKALDLYTKSGPDSTVGSRKHALSALRRGAGSFTFSRVPNTDPTDADSIAYLLARASLNPITSDARAEVVFASASRDIDRLFSDPNTAMEMKRVKSEFARRDVRRGLYLLLFSTQRGSFEYLEPTRAKAKARRALEHATNTAEVRQSQLGTANSDATMAKSDLDSAEKSEENRLQNWLKRRNERIEAASKVEADKRKLHSAQRSDQVSDKATLSMDQEALKSATKAARNATSDLGQAEAELRKDTARANRAEKKRSRAETASTNADKTKKAAQGVFDSASTALRSVEMMSADACERMEVFRQCFAASPARLSLMITQHN